MSFNLVETVKALFNHEVVSHAAPSLGESENGIQKALSAIVPVILGGIVSKASGRDDGSVFDMARTASGGGLSNIIRGLATGDFQSIISRGMDLVHGIFGSHAVSVNKSVAAFSGVKESSANSLMALVAPVVLGKLGEHAAQNNLNASSFGSFLESQKSDIMNAMPAGLSMGNLPGWSALSSVGGSATAAATDIRDRASVHTNRPVTDVKTSSNKWLLPLILIAAAVVLWYLLSKGCNQPQSTTTTHDTTAVVTPPVTADTTATTTTTTRTSTKVRLANGTELNAYTGGVEEQLVRCLDDASCQAGKDKWFDFDNINFEVGSARLTAESQEQVRNIAAILAAYPAAHIKVGGYTDKTGDAASNKTLSQQRADAVLGAIRSAGGKAEQLTGAEGYGSEFATVAETASDEERRKDRRIALQLNAK
ncbi:MAG: DUF937 domain-containing protein [Chitinophagaceae bacterium]|nr:MAG: DUF937 domain-containing protein [Chitinophagaceae bacterium]